MRWVRIERTEGGMTCEVAGIGHHAPVVRPVSAARAAALVAEGVPVVVHRKSA